MTADGIGFVSELLERKGWGEASEWTWGFMDAMDKSRNLHPGTILSELTNSSGQSRADLVAELVFVASATEFQRWKQRQLKPVRLMLELRQAIAEALPLDLESCEATDRDDVVSFIREVEQRLGKRLSLSMKMNTGNKPNNSN